MSRTRNRAACNGGSWHLEQIADSESPSFTSMALASDDSPQVVYHSRVLTALRHATRSGNSWSIETVDSIGSGNGWTSVGVRGSTVSIAYTETVFSDLKVATGGPGNWQLDTIDDGGNAGMECNLTFTPSGARYVIYLTNRPDARVSLAIE